MANSEQERRIARVIEEYDLQGWHRSGTEVDGASARWLADRVAGCGLKPTLERVPFDRLDPGPAYVQTGGRRAAGVPLFDGGLTGPEGVSGSLGALGSGSAIGVTELGAEPMTRYIAWVHSFCVVAHADTPGSSMAASASERVHPGRPLTPKMVGGYVRRRV